MAFLLALITPLAVSAASTGNALSILNANNASAIAMCLKQEKSTYTLNLKSAKDAYQKSVDDAKRIYKAAMKAADDTLKAANAAENSRDKTASQACKANNANTPKFQTTPTAATGTVSVVVQDGAGHAFAHPTDFDIRTGNEGETPLFGSLTGDTTKTSQAAGKYTVVARSLKYDGVIYTTKVTLSSTKDTITNQGDTVSYRIDYLAPGKIEVQLYDQQAGISAILHGPNGWSSSTISDMSMHTFNPISAGDYWLGVGMPTDRTNRLGGAKAFE